MENHTLTPRWRKVGLIAASAWTLAILALCTISGSELPDVRIFSADKIGHFSMFAVLGWLWMRALPMDVPVRIRWVVGAGLAYAALTEIYQGIIPIDRDPDVWDAVANAIGLIVGVSLWHLRRGTTNHRPKRA